MDFLVKVAAMSLDIENETWPLLGYCSFCSKIFHSNVSSDNSKRSGENTLFDLNNPNAFQPPIITMLFSKREEIIVDSSSANGSLGPTKF